MPNILIVVSGKATSGKTTVADFIKEIVTDTEVQKWSFATSLKQIAKDIFDWNGDKDIYYENIQVSDRTYPLIPIPIPDRGRQLLINIGGYFRNIRQSVWVDLIMKKISEYDRIHLEKDNIHCIDDLRFLNEISVVKKYNKCITIRIKRDSVSIIDDQSENDLDNEIFDYYIENNGTKEQLRTKIEKLVGDIGCKNNVNNVNNVINVRK